MSNLLSMVPLTFSSPSCLCIGLAMVVAIIGIALIRIVQASRPVQISIAGGALLLAIAAGEPVINRPVLRSIVVMVDLSPSTRSATFRDRTALNLRIHQVLGDEPFTMQAFADRNQSMPDGPTLPDIPVDQTVFFPPSADAIVLLSDGQFELAAFAPPTYPIIDPALDQPGDSSVNDLKQIDQQVLASVANKGLPRPLKWANAKSSDASTTTGDFMQMATPTGTGEVTASLPPGDRWPENDSLSIALAPPIEQQKWWIGGNAPADWRHFSPYELPSDSSAFLQTSIIVLNNVAADELASDQQAHLLQYVRDLGGAVMIVGGPHAFAAGGYQNTPLDQLSPLGSSPPDPTLQWLLLIDSSGSVAGDPWHTEVAAITQLLPQLPAADSVSVGNFAESVNWWSTGKSAGQTAQLAFPPTNISPHGPTNLAAALGQITAACDGSSPAELLLITDADANLPNPVALSTAMKAKKIHLHLLAIGQGSALLALRSIANETGGSVIQQLDPAQWISSANQLLRSALPDHYQHRFIELTPAPPASILEWNQTWLKTSAIGLQSSGNIPIVARWQMGLGQVMAIAYPAATADVARLAVQIQQPATDPRFKVTWETASKLRVKVDAIDRDHYMNRLAISLDILDPRAGATSPATLPIPQTGPGEYEIVIPSSQNSQLLTVKNGNQIVRRFSVAGRYPPEFEAIGNNRENLRQLAQRTGGSVINPGPVKKIDFPHRLRQTNIAPVFAFAGFLSLAAGLIQHHRRGSVHAA